MYNVYVNGVVLNVHESGNRTSRQPTLVFLHYFGGSLQSWLPLMECLPEDIHCVAPDLRGFGNSDAPEAGYSVADGADDVDALIAFLELDSYVLVGHSMGGKIALSLAARQPRGLRSLILLAPSPPTPEPIKDAERDRLLNDHPDRISAEATLEKITAHRLPLPLYDQAVADNLRSSEPAWSSWLRHGSREDISGQIDNVEVPVVVVSGTADRAIPTDIQEREVTARLPGSRLITLSDIGHLSPLEAPETVASILELEVRALARACLPSTETLFSD